MSFQWNSRVVFTFIDINATTTFKTQKCSKDSVKIKQYSCSFIKLRLKPLCHMDYFNTVLLRFWALALQSMQKALRFHPKYLKCSEDERRSYGFGTTWGWVINDIICGWTIPLRARRVKKVKYTVLEGRMYQMIKHSKGIILAEVWFYNNKGAALCFLQILKKKNYLEFTYKSFL